MNLVEKSPLSNSLVTSISATVWSTGVNRVRNFEKVTGQRFDNGLQYLLQVKVEYHIAYGLKLNILDLDPRFTLGKLAMERQLTLNRLLNENPGFVTMIDGEFSSFNKLRVRPTVIQRIALIGSPGTDGFRDFIHELEHNLFEYKFQIDRYPAAVQGTDADLRMTEKLIEILTLEIKYDVVVVVRGGGADTDLMAFDSYMLSRAIARFPIPVITGIGHTRNESIADMMAWKALKTPTKAAAFIIDHNKGFEDSITLLWKHITTFTPVLINREKEQLFRARSALHSAVQETSFLHRQNLMLLKNEIANRAKSGISRNSSDLQTLQVALTNLVKTSFQNQREELKLIGHGIKMMGPEKILKRGFALVYRNGKLVKDPALLDKNDKIQTRFYNAEIDSTITGVNLKYGETDL